MAVFAGHDVTGFQITQRCFGPQNTTREDLLEIIRRYFGTHVLAGGIVYLQKCVGLP